MRWRRLARLVASAAHHFGSDWRESGHSSRMLKLRSDAQPSSSDDVLDCGPSETNSCDGASSSPF